MVLGQFLKKSALDTFLKVGQNFKFTNLKHIARPKYDITKMSLEDEIIQYIKIWFGLVDLGKVTCLDKIRSW